MQRLICALTVLALPWWASQALAADCNRMEYREVLNFVAPCKQLGVTIQVPCTDDKLAAARSDLDWILSGNAAALDAFRASVKEQIACGYPQILLTFHRAVLVSVKPHDPLAQCMIAACAFQIDRILQDMDDQGKLPKD